jgi:hypothetical protein
MKKRLHKLKKHPPKKSTTSVESPAYVGGMHAAKFKKPIIGKIAYFNVASSRMDIGLQSTLNLRKNVLFNPI